MTDEIIGTPSNSQENKQHQNAKHKKKKKKEKRKRDNQIDKRKRMLPTYGKGKVRYKRCVKRNKCLYHSEPKI